MLLKPLGTNVTGTTNSTNHTLVAEWMRLIVVAISWYNAAGSGPSAALYGGVAMTAGGDTSQGNDGGVRMWYLLEKDMPADGVNAVTFTGSALHAKVSVMSFSGVKQQAPFDTFTTSGGVWANFVKDSLVSERGGALHLFGATMIQYNNYNAFSTAIPNSGTVTINQDMSSQDMAYFRYDHSLAKGANDIGVYLTLTDAHVAYSFGAVFTPADEGGAIFMY